MARMNPVELSRRRFLAVTGAGVLVPGTVFGRALPTVQQIVDRVQKNVGVPWQAKTVDGIKAGNPDTPVTGIAATSLATLTVLQRAVASGKNLIVTYEPTFYGQTDLIGTRADDPVYVAKKNFIEQNKLAVFRFHDHWLARTSDPVLQGLTEALGWQKRQTPGAPNRFTLPTTTLDAIVGDVQKKMKSRAMRVIGDPQSKIGRVALLPGVSPLAAALKTLPDVDLIIAGEMREWEGVEYTQDSVSAGKKKGLILLGRVLSEEPAMNVCARWLKTLVREVPVEWIPVGDPYWRLS